MEVMIFLTKETSQDIFTSEQLFLAEAMGFQQKKELNYFSLRIPGIGHIFQLMDSNFRNSSKIAFRDTIFREFVLLLLHPHT